MAQLQWLDDFYPVVT